MTNNGDRILSHVAHSCRGGAGEARLRGLAAVRVLGLARGATKL